VTGTVCLLSPAPLWVDPRLRKSADALAGAGYDVVVGYRADGDVARDDALLATAPWRWHRVDLGRSRQRRSWVVAALRQRAAEWTVRGGARFPALDAAAYCRGSAALLRWAVAQRADLYIAHAQPVLALAARAAARWHVPFAFDCEDLLAEEAADGGRALWRRALIGRLERRYLAAAAYVTTPSTPVAAYLEARYSLRPPRVVRNCFPARLADGVAPPADRRGSATPDLAWLSATIGPGRGLEDIFGALAGDGAPATLHLYGALPAEQRAWFETQVARLRSGVTVTCHGVLPEADIVRTLARHQVGLALETNACLNKRLTASNKIFLYLQAGLACIATSTEGHRSVLDGHPGAAALYAPGDVEGLRHVLEAVADPAALAGMQAAAWRAGREYVWDAEQHRLLEAVVEAIGYPPRGTR
jgi:glycosyl transferase family 4